jgi:hypothetical protein
MYARLVIKSLYALLPVVALLTSSLASAEVTFLGDWADFGSQFQLSNPYDSQFVAGTKVQWVAGSGPNHWGLVQEKGVDRLSVVQDATSPRGGSVLQVKVLPGDSVGYSGERAEVSDMLNPTGAPYPVIASNNHEVYGISIKLDPHWQPPSGKWRWGIFLQLHCPNQFGDSPAFSFQAEDQFHINTSAGDLHMANGQIKPATPLALTNGDLRPGHWVQFLIDVVWAYDNHGSLTVYRRDEGETGFATVLTQVAAPTLQFDSQVSNSQNTDPSAGTPYVHYWKTGFYRSESPGVTSQLALGPLVRGQSISEVTAAAFGTVSVPNPPSMVTVKK